MKINGMPVNALRAADGDDSTNPALMMQAYSMPDLAVGHPPIELEPEHDCDEWDAARAALRAEVGDGIEAWRYAGSSFRDERWQHDFTQDGSSDCRSVPATEGWPCGASGRSDSDSPQDDYGRQCYDAALETAIDGDVELEVWVALYERLVLRHGVFGLDECARGIVDVLEERLFG